MALDARKPVFGGYEQQRQRPACASAQTAQRHCYSFYLYMYLPQVKFQLADGTGLSLALSGIPKTVFFLR